MTTVTMTLTEFLLARIAEDEAVAEVALDDGFGGWEYFADQGVNYEARTHIARHDPARVLAECEAKRRIVEEHRKYGADATGWLGEDFGLVESACTRCGTPDAYASPWPCLTVRALAAVYADHPDYRDEWRP